MVEVEGKRARTAKKERRTSEVGKKKLDFSLSFFFSLSRASAN